jgi:uncharacterized membrane protein YfhO
MCVELDFPKRNNVSIWKNGEHLYSETMSLSQMLAVGDVRSGDQVKIKATCKNANESSTLSVSAAILDVGKYSLSYQELDASTLELTEFGNTYMAGFINCEKDGLLYTSIPQNGNWSVKVDGRKAEVVLTGDVMVGVMLTEGYHEVEFEYHNAAFAWGWKISLMCAAGFGAVVWQDLKKKSVGGKYEK